MPYRENQSSINDWQDKTFPLATREGVLKHLREEMEEFFEHPCEIEAADIVILLFAYAKKDQFDLLRVVDEKMTVNRARNWNIQSDGTGRHK